MEANIGEKVKVKRFTDLPNEMRTNGVARLCGRVGEVVDKLWSGAQGCYVYKIKFEDFDKVSSVDFVMESFDLVEELNKKQYTIDFEFLDNLVIARLIEIGDDYKEEIARGHGHIIHEGLAGITQAASYAVKKIYFKFENGELNNV